MVDIGLFVQDFLQQFGAEQHLTESIMLESTDSPFVLEDNQMLIVYEAVGSGYSYESIDEYFDDSVENGHRPTTHREYLEITGNVQLQCLLITITAYKHSSVAFLL
jgi:hypothetical protein